MPSLLKRISTLRHLPATPSRWNGRQSQAAVAAFPEIDRIAYFSLPVAMKKIIAYQQPFLRELENRLA